LFWNSSDSFFSSANSSGLRMNSIESRYFFTVSFTSGSGNFGRDVWYA